MSAVIPAVCASTSSHDPDGLAHLFNTTFRNENTVLLPHPDAWTAAGTLPMTTATEPLYLPASADCLHHRIVFAHGFFASALHEVAHWCIAGRERRRLPDYGYWYAPDDRGPAEQAEFERVEAKPQAIEWAFSRAARFPFRISLDNLSGIDVDREGFEAKVREALQRFESNGFPPRAQRFIAALSGFYGESKP